MKYNKIYLICLLLLAWTVQSCSDMNELSDKYLDKGEVIYAAKVDSVKALPGENRLQLNLFVGSQRIDKIRIFWNDYVDSTEVRIGGKTGVFPVLLEDMPENDYLFQVVSFDKFGNRSLKFEATGISCGERYKNRLLNRHFVAEGTWYDSETHELHIHWREEMPDIVKMVVQYTDIFGKVREQEVPVSENNTVIRNLKGDVSYWCYFKPSKDAIDVFAAAPTVIEVVDKMSHGTAFLLNTHQVGNGVKICIIGDGFSATDNQKDGKWETVCKDLTAKFLSIPIIRDFKEYFDIYMVVAESPTSGIVPDNIFGSGAGYADFNKANTLINQSVPDLADRPDRTLIFVGNGMIGGYAYGPGSGHGGIAVYSTDEGVNGYWMAHECVGHAFASLGDQYGGAHMGGPSETIKQGLCINCSATDDPGKCPWAQFIGLPGYEEVGIYEVGRYGDEGVWRPEEWSIMVDNRFGREGDYAIYFDAPSRLGIYKTIHDLAGIDYSFNDFLEFDKKYCNIHG